MEYGNRLLAINGLVIELFFKVLEHFVELFNVNGFKFNSFDIAVKNIDT